MVPCALVSKFQMRKKQPLRYRQQTMLPTTNRPAFQNIDVIPGPAIMPSFAVVVGLLHLV
jgi:hypothetical protein